MVLLHHSNPNAPIDDKSFVKGVIAHPKPFSASFTPRVGDEKHLRQVVCTGPETVELLFHDYLVGSGLLLIALDINFISRVLV